MTKKPPTIRDRIAKRIRRSRRADVFVRDDFADFGAYDVVGRELRKLAGEGLLIKVGYGLYARANRSVLSGKPIPSAPLIEIGHQRCAGSVIEAEPGCAVLLRGTYDASAGRRLYCGIGGPRQAKDCLWTAPHRILVKRLTHAGRLAGRSNSFLKTRRSQVARIPDSSPARTSAEGSLTWRAD